MSDDVAAIVADKLTKARRGRRAVDRLCLEVESGTVLGLIGPNGAGKTTTIRMLLGMLRPTSGSSRILGEDSLSLTRQTRQRIGYLSEEPFPFDNDTVPGLMQFVSGFFAEWDEGWCEHLMTRFRIDRQEKLRAMSAGERRLAELALTLASKPDLLILDDPAIGLDANVRREFLWAALETAREEGKTVLLSSHILHDVERVVDRVCLLDQGAMRCNESLEELQSRVRRLVFTLPDPEEAVALRVPGEVSRRMLGRDLVVVTEACTAELEAQFAADAEVRIESLGLEEIFVELTSAAAEAEV